MESILVTFPEEISPAVVKDLMEGNIEQNTNFTCSVNFMGIEDNQNVFKISSTDGPEAFYVIGICASAIVRVFS